MKVLKEKIGNATLIVRPRNAGGGYEIAVDPPLYNVGRLASDFATEADAIAWLEVNRTTLEEKLR